MWLECRRVLFRSPPSLRYFWKLYFGGASPVCLKSSLFPVLLSVPLVRSSLFLWLVPPCVVVVPQGMAMSSSKDYLKCREAVQIYSSALQLTVSFISLHGPGKGFEVLGVHWQPARSEARRGGI